MKPTIDFIRLTNISLYASPPVSIIVSTLPSRTAAIAPISFATWYAAASLTSIAFSSPSSAISHTSIKLFVPRYATIPPLPVIIDFISACVYLPLKHRSASCPAGSVPDRSGEKGPSPLSALFTSTTLPFLWAPTLIPPPICAIIRLISS